MSGMSFSLVSFFTFLSFTLQGLVERVTAALVLCVCVRVCVCMLKLYDVDQKTPNCSFYLTVSPEYQDPDRNLAMWAQLSLHRLFPDANQNVYNKNKYQTICSRRFCPVGDGGRNALFQIEKRNKAAHCFLSLDFVTYEHKNRKLTWFEI